MLNKSKNKKELSRWKKKGNREWKSWRNRFRQLRQSLLPKTTMEKVSAYSKASRRRPNRHRSSSTIFVLNLMVRAKTRNSLRSRWWRRWFHLNRQKIKKHKIRLAQINHTLLWMKNQKMKFHWIQTFGRHHLINQRHSISRNSPKI